MRMNNQKIRKKKKNKLSQRSRSGSGKTLNLSKKIFLIGVGLLGFAVIGGVFIVSVFLSHNNSVTYISPDAVRGLVNDSPNESKSPSNKEKKDNNKEEEAEKELPTTHVETPSEVKAVYVSSWTAATPKRRERIFDLIENTEVNSIVIDIKDYSGMVAFRVPGKKVEKLGATRKRTPEIKSFINRLHERGVYVIGRIVVFQDPYLAEKKKDISVQRKNDGALWSDKKGLHYIDPGARLAWDYNLELAEYAYKNKGFDEINFDYIRFPSDGDTDNTHYPVSSPKMNKSTSTYGKPEVLESFFAYLKDELDKVKGIKTSADLFGMTATSKHGMNIGQVLEKAVPYFDYIAPMVYPSHYPAGFNGWSDPNDYPYEVVEHSMTRAVTRLKNASTSPDKLRPWLQDFDYGGDYGPTEVRDQIQATYDSGLSSWMLWSPKNIYTREALEKN